MSQSTENKPKTEAIGALKFGLHLGTNYGQSTASLIIEAMQVHRDTMFDLMFEHIREGEYKNAYVYYGCHSDLQNSLDTLLNEAITVADHNHTVFEYKNNPAAYRQWTASRDKDNAERYDRFLKLILASYANDDTSDADAVDAQLAESAKSE